MYSFAPRHFVDTIARLDSAKQPQNIRQYATKIKIDFERREPEFFLSS